MTKCNQNRDVVMTFRHLATATHGGCLLDLGGC